MKPKPKNPTKTVSFDIETIANPAMLEFLPEVTAKKGLKDPDKIEADIKEKVRTQIEGMALDPRFCLICCFGWAANGETGHIMLPDESEASEKGLLQEAWEMLAQHNHFVGFNSLSLDVPVMLMRSLFRRVRPAVNISLQKYRITNHTDCRMILGNWNQYAPGTLDWYAKTLIGKGKTEGISGSQVADYWEMGLKSEIGLYCEQDAYLTGELFQLIQEYYLL